MRLRVQHTTWYEYSAAVSESFNEARLGPYSSQAQDCEKFHLHVQPPARCRQYFDFYRNRVHCFEIASSHSELMVKATSEVTTNSTRLLSSSLLTCPRSELPACGRLEECYDFLQPSTYVELDPHIWRLALDIGGDASDVWALATRLMCYVHGEFRYEPASTHVHTRMPEVLQSRCGVCQDFAHVLLALCRSVKIPARYVSGYLYNGPLNELRGAQATHAWVEVYVPQFGWRGLDPTNARQADEHYIKVAHGRDYGDALPLCGHFKGAAEQSLRVSVSVELL